MEGDGGAGSSAGAPWDLGPSWAPTTTSPAYHPQSFVPRQQMQQELTSLKLGKRPSCLPSAGQGDGGGGGVAADGRRKDKAAAAAAVPRCQVEGCHVALVGAKEYHRRHKVCEAHSKAPKVVVHGAEQRFCQQCSRFHGMSEFDDAKRSCRRRLAGHNERRRKSNASEAMARGSAHPRGLTSLMHGFPPYGGLPTSPAGALSLLSSSRGAPWQISAPVDMFSVRSSAALDELIAENRAALMACHFFPDRSAGQPAPTGRAPAEMPAGWHAHGVGRHARDAPAGHVTLDLMQAPTATSGPFQSVPPDRASKDSGAGRRSGVWMSAE